MAVDRSTAHGVRGVHRSRISRNHCTQDAIIWRGHGADGAATDSLRSTQPSSRRCHGAPQGGTGPDALATGAGRARATAYVEHRELAEHENAVERFFLNVELVRVLYAHALVATPRLAQGPLARLGPETGR